jgi:hypothetical protein
MDNRMQVRDEARKKGVWPPPGGGDRLLTQENKILLPSAFSPLQSPRRGVRVARAAGRTRDAARAVV